MPSIALVGPSSFDMARESTSTGVFLALLKDAFVGEGWEVKCLDRRINRGPVPTDVVLFHDYHDAISQYIGLWGGAKVRAYFMEVPHVACDVSFTFGTKRVHKSPSIVYVGHPVWGGLKRRERDESVVLVDHAWLPTRAKEFDWTDELYRELQSVPGIRVLGIRARWAEVPSWAEPIGAKAFPEYVSSIERAGVFVVTHKGSYNGTVFDMLALGAKVICPTGFLLPKFAPGSLGVVEIDRPEDLASALACVAEQRDVTVPVSGAVSLMSKKLKTMLEAK